jgi:hypothetical protein
LTLIGLLGSSARPVSKDNDTAHNMEDLRFMLLASLLVFPPLERPITGPADLLGQVGLLVGHRS